jgi:hypothetical protein
MQSSLEKIKAIYNTLEELGLDRLKIRLLRDFRYKFLYPRWGRTLLKTIPILDQVEPSTGDITSLLTSHASEKEVLKEAEALRRQTFTFLNLPVKTFTSTIDWRCAPNHDPLWQYCLHYGEWALTLAQAFRLTGNTVYRQTLMKLMTDWREHNPPGSRPGWEPYPLARRLVAWSKVAVSLKEDGPWRSFWQSTLASCLLHQTQVLAKNLETDLANNHVIADYRALAWMGLLFPDWPGAADWRQSGLTGLWGEMDRQVLADGVHDERSLSYHAMVLQDLVETWDLCKRTGVRVPGHLEQRFSLMSQFLIDMQTPDGSYPMVNDTVSGYPGDFGAMAASTQACLDYWTPAAANHARDQDTLTEFPPITSGIEGGERWRPGATAYPEAGYVILRGEAGDFLCFDAGPLGPAHLPGHGHADALSLVLCHKNQPVIVDPGVYSYHDKTWRDHFRSTRAHNTVCLDGQDQCVFWGAFRVAYAPRVCLLSWSDRHAAGEHDGYLRLPDPVRHRRQLRQLGPGQWELHDSFNGRGRHEFALSLQLAPGATVEQQGLTDFAVSWPGCSLKISVRPPLPGQNASMEPGWVSLEWNLKTPAPRYVLRWTAPVPTANCLVLTLAD